MRNLKRREVLFLAAVPLLAASADDLLYDQIRRKLANDQIVQGGAIDVDVKSGAVILKGKVSSDKAKARATKLTKDFKGVKSVDNQLVVTKI
jgi:osmotically-inducible protein OsmY